MKNSLERLALNSNLSPEAKAIYLLLLFSSEGLSETDIAYSLRMSSVVVSTALSNLVFFGFVIKKHGAITKQDFYIPA